MMISVCIKDKIRNYRSHLMMISLRIIGGYNNNCVLHDHIFTSWLQNRLFKTNKWPCHVNVLCTGDMMWYEYLSNNLSM